MPPLLKSIVFRRLDTEIMVYSNIITIYIFYDN